MANKVKKRGRKAEQPLVQKPSKNFRAAHDEGPSFASNVTFLFIGPVSTVLTVHADLIPPQSLARLNADCQGMAFYRLPHLSVESASLWRSFLYTGRVFSQLPGDQDFADNGSAEVHADGEWLRLAEAYFHGKAVEDEAFCNAVINTLVEKVHADERYPTGVGSEVYQHTGNGDCLRKLIMDMHVFFGRGTGIEEPHEDATGPARLLLDVRRRLREIDSRGELEGWAPWEIPGGLCEHYHTHRVTAKCSDD